MPMPLCKFRCRSLTAAAFLLLAQPGAVAGLDSRTAIERAVLQIELGDLALARSYLARPLIDPRITAGERSRAYYLQGYSLELANHHVSAAQNYARALALMKTIQQRLPPWVTSTRAALASKKTPSKQRSCYGVLPKRATRQV